METIKEVWYAVINTATKRVEAVFSDREKADQYAIENDFTVERQPERVRITIDRIIK